MSINIIITLTEEEAEEFWAIYSRRNVDPIMRVVLAQIPDNIKSKK